MGCRSLRRGGAIAGTGEMQPPEDFCKSSAWGRRPFRRSRNPRAEPVAAEPVAAEPEAPPGLRPAPPHFSLDSQGALAVVYISINVGSRL